MNIKLYKITEYHSVKVKLPHIQLDELKSASSKMIGTDETNFPHNLLLADRQVPSLCKAFANKSSKDIKLSKTARSEIIPSGGFLTSWTINKSWTATDDECTDSVGEKCVDTIMIDSSSISSQCRNP